LIRFIHTGDLHLGLQFKNVSFSSEIAMDRRRELWETFERIVNYSIDRNADFLLIAGDLFESCYFTLGDIKRVRDILSKASELNVLISAGNHDYIGHKSIYRQVEWGENIKIFETDGLECKSFTELNTNIYGYSWNRAEIKENKLLNDFPYSDRDKNNLLLIHGDISNNSNYLPMNINFLKDLEMDYIALGHIHKPRLFSQRIAYCGCPEPLDFGETGIRGIIEGTIDQGITNIEFIPFSKREFHEVTIDLNENLGYLDLINRFENVSVGDISKDFYRIKLKGYLQKDIDLNNIIGDVAEKFYHIEIVDETIPDYDLDSLKNNNKDNIIGHFIKTMQDMDLDDKINKDALYYGLNVLLKDRY